MCKSLRNQGRRAVSMTAVLQTARDLRLHLVKGPLANPAEYEILQKQRMVSGPWTINAHIIGASHLISIQYKDLLWHEIFACMTIQDDPEQLYSGRLKDVNQLIHRFADQIEYHFRSETLSWDRGEPILNVLEEKANQSAAGQIGLVEDFLPIDTTVVPKTIIVITVNGKVLEFETLHSYPNEERLVFTQTLIKEML